MQLDKRVFKICRNTQKYSKCDKSCALSDKCIRFIGKHYDGSLIDYFKDLNQYVNNIDNVKE